MHKKYITKALILDKKSSEKGYLVLALTEEFGLIFAEAQSAQKSGAKLKSLLEPGSYSILTLLNTRSGFKIVGVSNHKNILPKDPELFKDVVSFFTRFTGQGQGGEYEINLLKQTLEGRISPILFKAKLLKNFGWIKTPGAQLEKMPPKELEKEIQIAIKQSQL